MATLYRKYRPQTFEQIVGQEHVVQTLRKAIELDRIGHAYIFSGARGVGKTTLARLLAKAVNCLSEKNRPCGKCNNCLEIASGKFVDLIEIDAASNRGIDEMRDLRDRVQFAPSVGRKRVYIIDEVHMLTREAFNALLKTLEEPPSHTVFIFATTEIHKVPATILSRCQRFDFMLGDDQMIRDNITDLAKKEKLKITPEVVELIAFASGGSFRDAQSILDQLSSHLYEKELTQAQAAQLLNLSGYEQVGEFIKALSEGLEVSIEFIKKLKSKNIDFVSFTDSVISELRSRMISAIEQDQDPEVYMGLIKIFLQSKDLAKYSPVDSLALELAVIEIAESVKPSTEGSEKDDKGEKKSFKQDKDEDQPEKKLDKVVEKQKNSEKKEKKDKKQATKEQAIEGQVADISNDQRNAIMEALSQKSMALSALLRLAQWRVENNKLIFEVEYPIYKEKIMAENSKKILRECAGIVFGSEVIIDCVVCRPADVESDIEAVFSEGI